MLYTCTCTMIQIEPNVCLPGGGVGFHCINNFALANLIVS